MPALAELQGRLRDAILHGTAAGLAGVIEGDGLAVEQRVAVYRNNTFITLTEALKATYPVVCRLVDERFFAYAAHAFIARHPPRNGRVAAYGAGFAHFLAGFAPARHLAYLPDVARLEWAMNEAYHAAGPMPLDPAALAPLGEEGIARLTFLPHPSVRLLASRFPVDRIWEANQPGRPGDADLDAAGDGGTRIVVQRPRLEVVYRPLPPGGFAFLRALVLGRTLLEAADEALRLDPGFDLQTALIDNLVAGTFTATAAAPLMETER